jgi:hypothetical protein
MSHHFYHSAHKFAERLHKKEPKAIAKFKKLAACAETDEACKKAYHAVCVVYKKEFKEEPVFAGGLPAIASTAGKITKLALSPVAFVLQNGGKAVQWAGSQIRHLSHII